MGSQYNDKAVVKPSYLYNGESYIGKTVFLYWDGPNKVSICLPGMPHNQQTQGSIQI